MSKIEDDRSTEPLTDTRAAYLANLARIGGEIGKEATQAAHGTIWMRVRRSGSSALLGAVAGALVGLAFDELWMAAIASVVLLSLTVWTIREQRAWSRRFEAEADRLKAERLPHLFGRGES